MADTPIKVGDGLKQSLLEAGMVPEIPISDEHVISVLTGSLGLIKGTGAHTRSGYILPPNPDGEESHLFLKFDSVRAVADEVDMSPQKAPGQVLVRYRLEGFGGINIGKAVEIIEEHLTPSPQVVEI